MAAGGLVLLNTTSFTTQSSVSVNDVFSATYDNYQIYINITASTTSNAGQLRFRVSGSDNSSSNYENGVYAVGAYSSGTAGSDNSELRNYFGVVGLHSTVGGQGIVNVQNPFTTNYTKILEHSVGEWMRVGGGVMTVTTSYTGFTYIQPVGNFTGTISVYGIKK